MHGVKLTREGWKSKDIARALGVSPSAISQWLKMVDEEERLNARSQTEIIYIYAYAKAADAGFIVAWSGSLGISWSGVYSKHRITEL